MHAMLACNAGSAKQDTQAVQWLLHAALTHDEHQQKLTKDVNGIQSRSQGQAELLRLYIYIQRLYRADTAARVRVGMVNRRQLSSTTACT
jgi:hypothetical protein